MKILYVTTIGITMGFFKSLIKELIDEGHTVDLACNAEVSPVPLFYEELGCRIHQIDCSRSPLHKANMQAVKRIRRLVEENHYDIVHCHTPVAAACTRLACRKLRKKQGVKVFYTAHGFHFYKGAPLKNWLLYYPVEKFCARYTDKLITINQEDFALAQKKMKAKEILYVPGVGIDLSRFKNLSMDKSMKRHELGIPEDAILMISVGELSKRKNHQIVLQALTQIDNENLHYIIVGKGALLTTLQEFANTHKIANRVRFLGYRSDIAELYNASDICCFPSFQEGLPVALMEAMASGLPCAVSRIRGNTDLISESGGVFFDPHDVSDCREAIQRVLSGDMTHMSQVNRERVEDYSLNSIMAMMKSIYES